MTHIQTIEKEEDTCCEILIEKTSIPKPKKIDYVPQPRMVTTSAPHIKVNKREVKKSDSKTYHCFICWDCGSVSCDCGCMKGCCEGCCEGLLNCCGCFGSALLDICTCLITCGDCGD